VSTIKDVVGELGEIITWSRREASPAGYFAALYRRVTEQVAFGIEQGRFQDAARMERFDVIFARRYLDAFSGWRNGAQISVAWERAFDGTEHWSPIVLQHLLGGMNAHINLDLGIAAASVAPGTELPGLQPDFQEINSILASLVQSTKDELAEIWTPLHWLDRVGGTTEDRFIDFSLTVARDGAWSFAQHLAETPAADWAALIRERDLEIGTRIADLIYRPGSLLRLLLLGIRLGERGTTAAKLDILSRLK